jgi:hypothetical protein
VLLLAGPGVACGSPDVRRQESGSAAELSAAARTLEALHRDRLTPQFARGAFVNYREQLAALDGAPLTGEPRRLWLAARPAVEAPCLDAGCDWRAQVSAMDAAAEALRRAGGG